MAEIPCPVAAHAADDPNAPALAGPKAAYSYRELDLQMSTVAKNLRDLGARRGDVVGICLPPSIEYAAIVLGVIRLGAIAFPINTRLPGSAVESQLDQVRCSILIAEGTAPTRSEPSTRQVLTPEHVLRPRASIRPRSERVTSDRPAVVVTTSGSTGQPKAAVLTYGNLYANATISNANLSLAPSDSWLLSLPLYHVSGLGVLFRCLVAGASATVPASGQDLSESIQNRYVTHVSLVSTQLIRLTQNPEDMRNLSRLKAILLGGSAMPGALLESALKHALRIYISYGLTETASQMATSRLTALPKTGRPSARVLTPGSLRVSSESEIEVRSATLFAGYLVGDSLDLPLTKDGWFRTGDLGSLDADGHLTVFGRKDNMFISGGENIQPEEIESVLCSLGGVTQALVVPISDSEYGRRPVAFVETGPGQVLDPEQFTRELSATLPRYKIPREYFPWPADLAAQGAKPNRQLFADRAATLAFPQNKLV